MRTELPVCDRCCFCLPLRCGLIAWGYVRLALSIVLFIAISIALYGILGKAKNNESISYNFYEIFLAIVLILLLTDIVLNAIFIIGGHKKNLKLLRAYYIYGCVLWSLTTLLGIAGTIYVLFLFNLGKIDLNFHIYVTLIDICTCLVQIVYQTVNVEVNNDQLDVKIAIQGYFLLLVRSEIIKLRSKCQFKFVNNAAESECMMKCDEETVDGEARTEGTYQNATSMYMPRDTSDNIGYVTRDNQYQ